MTSIHSRGLKTGRIIMEGGKWGIIKWKGTKRRRQMGIYGSLATLRSHWGILETSRRNKRGLALHPFHPSLITELPGLTGGHDFPPGLTHSVAPFIFFIPRSP